MNQRKRTSLNFAPRSFACLISVWALGKHLDPWVVAWRELVWTVWFSAEDMVLGKTNLFCIVLLRFRAILSLQLCLSCLTYCKARTKTRETLWIEKLKQDSQSQCSKFAVSINMTWLYFLINDKHSERAKKKKSNVRYSKVEGKWMEKHILGKCKKKGKEWEQYQY